MRGIFAPRRILRSAWATAGMAASLMLAGSLILSVAPRPLAVAAAPAAAAVKSDAAQAPQTVFTNASPITINDAANGTPYPSTINVSGLVGNIPATAGSVQVTLNNFSHTFPDDVGIVLVGPTGAALLLQDGAGDDPDMVNVTYTFSDTGATQLPNLTAWTAGTYKPTAFFTGDSFPAPGPLLAYSHPGPAGANTATFSSTFAGTAPNGNWNLFVIDFVGGDAGSISGGWSIDITTGAAPTGCTTSQRPVDFDGNGSSDYSTVRNTGGGPSGQISWFTLFNGGAAAPVQPWGIASDQFVPEDYDGDGKTDIAIWRPLPGGNSAFYILQSATNTLFAFNFGLIGDQPDVVGDYDGDNKADLAVYRPGATAGAHSFWHYRSSITSSLVSFEWGQNGDFPAPGDYDGDGKNDFVVQRNAGGGTAGFHLLLSAGGTQGVIFGTPTDVITPGYWDNDCKTDLAIVRGSGGLILWAYRSSVSGSTVTQLWGNSATDFPVMADYNSDGFTDYAVWRPDADPSLNFFHVLFGSVGGSIQREWGQNGDYPVANFNTH